jgi:hypothetical protein
MKISIRSAIRVFAMGMALAGAVAGCGGGKGEAHTSARSASQTSTALGTLGKGASPIPADAVAQVGSALVTRADLSHWMETLVGGDLYESKRLVAPEGLVSEPENLPRCVAAIKGFIGGGAGSPTPAQIERKCQQLHEALKNQALTSLVQYHWDIDRDAKLGVTIEPTDIQRSFAQIRAKEFPTQQKLDAYLARRRWTLADELLVVKRDLLGSAVLKKLTALGDLKAIERVVAETNEHEKAETTCRPGYVVEPCREFTSAAPESGPDALLAELSDWKRKARS